MENIRNELNDQWILPIEPQEMDADILLEPQYIKMEHSFTKDVPYRDDGLMDQITDYAYDVHRENATYDSPLPTKSPSITPSTLLSSETVKQKPLRYKKNTY